MIPWWLVVYLNVDYYFKQMFETATRTKKRYMVHLPGVLGDGMTWSGKTEMVRAQFSSRIMGW